MIPEKKLCKKFGHKNDTEKVVQKYAATKKYAEKPTMGKYMRKLCGKCFRWLGNRMLIKLLHRILEGCNSCFKTAIPKNTDLFSRCRKGQNFSKSFKISPYAQTTFSAYFSAYSRIFRIFPHFFQCRPTA